MKGCKILCSVGFSIILIICLAFQGMCSDLSSALPDYLNHSSGSFVECETNLGKGVFVLPISTFENTIGFTRSGNLYNISNSTVSGLFITSNGTEYNVRAQSLNCFQYQSDNTSWGGTYIDITVESVLSTNINIYDYFGENDIVHYSFSNFELIVVSMLVFIGFCCFFSFIRNLYYFLKGSDRYGKHY